MALIPAKSNGGTAFYMDVHEVTVGQFRKFVEQTRRRFFYWHQVAIHSPSDDHPMVYVTWDDAIAYAKWVGKRLPTEAEWVHAARGGLIGKRYPWGDEEREARRAPPNMLVRSFEVNGYGLYGMGGNVSEWCAGWHRNSLRRVVRSALLSTGEGRDPTSRDFSIGFRCVADVP